MKFVKVQDEERPGEVAINLDLVREAHFGGGLLRLYFERGASQDDMRDDLDDFSIQMVSCAGQSGAALL